MILVNKNDSNNEFKKNIIVKQDEEKVKLLRLQQDYKNGLIEEFEIPEEDKNKLLNLYYEQNKKIKEKMEKDKIAIKRMLEQLKNEI